MEDRGITDEYTENSMGCPTVGNKLHCSRPLYTLLPNPREEKGSARPKKREEGCCYEGQ